MSTLIQTFVGNIGIGTNDPGNYKLRVDGEVRANSLEVNGVSNVHVPIGLIAMWYGSVASIPDGWALCDGSSATRTDGAGSITTPNLVNRFVRGADGDAPSPAVPGQTSGANAVAISVQNLPQHAHPFTGSNANAPHNHTTQTAYAPHNHNTSEANAPHTHNTHGANAPHSHSVHGANANHSHGWKHGSNRNQGYYQPSPGIVNASRRYPWSDNQGAIVGANAPHSHNTHSNNANHSHGVHAAQAEHSHDVGSSMQPTSTV